MSQAQSGSKEAKTAGDKLGANLFDNKTDFAPSPRGLDSVGSNASAAIGANVMNVVSPASAGGAYDPCDYLLGAWKRNLEWRHFGGAYPHLRTTNTVVVVDEYFSSVKEEGVRYLKWCFGKSLEKSELRFGYVMKV